MTQPFRALGALANVPGSVPSFHNGGLQLSLTAGIQVLCIHICRQTHICKRRVNDILKSFKNTLIYSLKFYLLLSYNSL